MQKGSFGVTDTEAFKREFRQRVEALPGVTQVEFIGSIAKDNFVPGKSDLDVFVHGHKIPRQAKKQARALVREFSEKYELGLDKAPGQHPTPFFIDSRLSSNIRRSENGSHY